MVVNNNDTFAALSDPTRREIISRLVDGPASVSQLVEPFNISQQAVSKHIAVLRNAGHRATGARRAYQLVPAGAQTAGGGAGLA